jgi:hypothetical protein
MFITKHINVFITKHLSMKNIFMPNDVDLYKPKKLVDFDFFIFITGIVTTIIYIFL